MFSSDNPRAGTKGASSCFQTRKTHFLTRNPIFTARLILSRTSHRRRRISNPAAIASTASTVLTVGETRTLSSGKSPVRINQIASRIIPRFLPARVLVIANLVLLLMPSLTVTKPQLCTEPHDTRCEEGYRHRFGNFSASAFSCSNK